MSKKRNLAKSFKYAGQGFNTIFRAEPNFRIHIAIGTIALTLAIAVGLSRLEWLLLLFMIAWVLIMEMINTILEQIVDMISPDIQPKAKVAKDVAAAAVLVSAILSITVGLLLFIPHLLG